MNAKQQVSAVYQDEVQSFIPYKASILSIDLQHSRARVTQPSSKWVMDLNDRFNELTALPRGWDGYEGRPVSFICAQFAANLIERLFVAGVRAPQLVPGGDGTLQIEWHENQFDIEIDVLGSYDIVATRHDHLTGNTEEIELQSDFSDLAEWIADLRLDRAQIQLTEI